MFRDVHAAGGPTGEAAGPTAKRTIEQFADHCCQYWECSILHLIAAVRPLFERIGVTSCGPASNILKNAFTKPVTDAHRGVVFRAVYSL